VNENELFQAALGLLPPWLVSRTFSESAERLDIHLDFPRGAVFPCPVCGVCCKAYDTDELTWRHRNFFQHQAFLHARTPPRPVFALRRSPRGGPLGQTGQWLHLAI
jgi:transposase